MDILYVLLATIELLLFTKISTAADTITSSKSISDGNTLVLKHGNFELGFFIPGYLGIWYKNIPVRTVVWVANRGNPINDTSGMLMINSRGNLVLVSHNGTVVWSTSSSKEAVTPIVQLLDSGNLVLRDEKDANSEVYLWQSFDHPSDTLLPGMKLGWDVRTGLNQRLSSWKNLDDPSLGELTFGIENHVYPEAVLRRGSEKYFRTGPWNGLRYSGAPELRSPNPYFEFNFISNREELYYIYHLKNNSVLTRILLNTTSSCQRYV